MPASHDKPGHDHNKIDLLDTLVISRRFCGPPNSGNGGYSCGRLAHYVDGPATVRLMQPPPLETPLEVVRVGEEVQLRSGEELVARAWPGGPQVDVPPAPGLAEARRRRGYYGGLDRHVFPGCFVCGVDRAEGDGLRVHAGPESPSGEGPHEVACNWTPDGSLCDAAGIVADHFVWAALDCPSGWAFLTFADEIALLGEYSAEVLTPLHCGREYIVTGWEISSEGRKRRTGSAIYAQDGQPVARAQATWIRIEGAGS